MVATFARLDPSAKENMLLWFASEELFCNIVSQASRPSLRRTPIRQGVHCLKNFGNGLTLVAGTWRNHRTVGVQINCLKTPASVSAHFHHLTQINKQSLIEALQITLGIGLDPRQQALSVRCAL